MRTLSQKSRIDAEARLKNTQRALDIVVHENNELKEQYDILQENFHKLCAFKGAKFLEKLIYKI